MNWPRCKLTVGISTTNNPDQRTCGMILPIPPVRRSCGADMMRLISRPRRHHGESEQVIRGSRRGAPKENAASSSCGPDTRGPKPLYIYLFAF